MFGPKLQQTFPFHHQHYYDDNDVSCKYNTFHYGPNLGVYEYHADAATELEQLLGKAVGMTIGTMFRTSVGVEIGIFISWLARSSDKLHGNWCQ